MVAETREAPPKRRHGERGPEIPLMVKLKVRTMYLNSGQTLRAIATATGLQERAVNRLVSQQGWTRLKHNLKESLERQQDAERDSLVTQAMEQIKEETISIAGDSMAKIRSALERDDRDAARDFQALTAGARNLVTIAKAIMQPSSADNAGSNVLNVFMLRAGDVTPDAKQVTEIEARPAS